MTARIIYLVPAGLLLERELRREFSVSGAEATSLARWLGIALERRRFANTYAYPLDAVVRVLRAVGAARRSAYQRFLRGASVDDVVRATQLATELVEHLHDCFVIEQWAHSRDARPPLQLVRAEPPLDE